MLMQTRSAESSFAQVITIITSKKSKELNTNPFDLYGDMLNHNYVIGGEYHIYLMHEYSFPNRYMYAALL